MENDPSPFVMPVLSYQLIYTSVLQLYEKWEELREHHREKLEHLTHEEQAPVHWPN